MRAKVFDTLDDKGRPRKVPPLVGSEVALDEAGGLCVFEGERLRGKYERARVTSISADGFHVEALESKRGGSEWYRRVLWCRTKEDDRCP